MAAVTPSSDLYLLQCPIEIDNRNQINFANTTNQYNYFFGLNKIGATNFSYQRKDSTIRYPAHIDSIRNFNYVMYRNDNYSNKWFYAFIEKMEYLNDSTTLIKIKTDVYQTWQFDLTFKRCFVEREHVNNDTFGIHTLEENLPSGEWINNATVRISLSNPKNCFVVALITELPDSMKAKYGNRSRVYNGIPNGCYIIMIDITDTSIGYRNLNSFISYFDYIGKSEAIICMYLVPKSIMGTSGTDYTEMSFDLGSGYSFDGVVPKSSSGVKLISTNTISKNSTLNGYTPKNNKCYTNQFNYMMVTNNAGMTETYNWEDFSGSAIFKLLATYQQGCPTKLIPTNYKGNDEPSGNAYAITGAPFPICTWNSDYYLNWQAKNGWTGFYQRAGEVVNSMEYTAGKDNPLQVIGNFAQTTANYIGQEMNTIAATLSGAAAKAERVPNQINGNPSNGDFTFSVGKCEFTVYKMSVRAEVAKIVDDYFSAYGYKVATWKTPNLTGRSNWNYVKLNQANIVANIPQEDLNEIKQIFLNGVTIWHKTAYFLDYSQNNPIV